MYPHVRPLGIQYLVGGIPAPLKNLKVSWDDDIPNINGKLKFMFQTSNQVYIKHGTSLNIDAY